MDLSVTTLTNPVILRKGGKVALAVFPKVGEKEGDNVSLMFVGVKDIDGEAEGGLKEG